MESCYIKNKQTNKQRNKQTNDKQTNKPETETHSQMYEQNDEIRKRVQLGSLPRSPSHWVTGRCDVPSSLGSLIRDPFYSPFQ